MTQNKLGFTQKNTASKKGFSLVEVLAASAVIITVSAVSIRLGSHTKAEVKELGQRLSVVNFISNTFEAMNQDLVPLTNYDNVTYCSACNSTLESCVHVCGDESNGYASTVQCGTAIENSQLSEINNSYLGCYVIVKISRCDSTMDIGNYSTVFDQAKAGQFCGLGTVVQPSNNPNGDDNPKHDYALSTFLFRS